MPVVIPDRSPARTVTVEAEIWRQPAWSGAGRFERYRIAIEPRDHVLNLLWRIRRTVDPTLAFPDHYCKVGTCGACALLVDGRPGLGCRRLVTALSITIAPAKGRAVIADLLTAGRADEKA